MSDRFYVNCPLGPGLIDLAGAEAHHLAAVCRLRPGNRVCLFNGDGCEYPGLVRSVARRAVVVELEAAQAPARELPYRLEVAAPLPRGDRGHLLVEKLTELGVTAYVPLRTQRSVVHPGDARRDRLERYVIEASKQCGRNVLMEVRPTESWEEYAARANLPATRVVAHPGAADAALAPPGGDVAVAVGPEGGFTDDEVGWARAHGWTAVGLGPRVLRVETAAVVMAAWAAGVGPVKPAAAP